MVTVPQPQEEPDRTDDLPLVGPRAHERKQRKNPWDVRVKEGDPLYYLLLPKGAAQHGYLRPDETREARKRLSGLIEQDRERVLSCQGKTREEALRILAEIDPSILQERKGGELEAA